MSSRRVAGSATAVAPAEPAAPHGAPALGAPQLEGLVVAFGLLGRLFWEEPQNGLVDDLACARDLLRREPFATASPRAAARLEQALAQYERDPQNVMRDLRWDRTYLFYQVGCSRTSPYESTYRTADHTLFGPTTAQVKEAYEQCGLRFEHAGSEPCDHFALECMFVTRLARAAVQASLTGDEPAVRGATAWMARFMREHLLVFGPVYLERFAERASTEFYRAAGELAQDVLGWAAWLLADGRGAWPGSTRDLF